MCFRSRGLPRQEAYLPQAGLLLVRYRPSSGMLLVESCGSPRFLCSLLRLCPALRPRRCRVARPSCDFAVSSPYNMTPRTNRNMELSRLNHAALTLAAYASPLRLLYTGKARFRARGLAFPDGVRVSPHPQGHFRKISVRLSSLPSSTGLCLARHGFSFSERPRG